MTTIQASGIDEATASAVRTTLIDRFGNHLKVVRAADTGPCRVCLRRPTDDDEMILFSHCPFEFEGPYKEIGPIFIHAHDCGPFRTVDELPEMTAANDLVTLRAYGDNRILDAAVVSGQASDASVRSFLERPEVEFVQVRSTSYGCWTYTVNRA